MKINDIQKNPKISFGVPVSARVPIEIKEYLKRNNISLAKLITSAVKELETGVEKHEL